MIGEAVLVAIIAAGASLVGTVLTIISSQKKTENNMRTAQAVTDTKLDALAEEVRRHNDFANRIPRCEAQLESINHRLDNLEKKIA